MKFESTDKRRGFLWIKVVKRNGYRFLRRSGRRSTGFRVHSERLRAGRHTIVVALYYGKRTPPQKRIPLVVKAGHTYRISCSFVKRGLVTKLVVKVYRDGRLTATY